MVRLVINNYWSVYYVCVHLKIVKENCKQIVCCADTLFLLREMYYMRKRNLAVAKILWEKNARNNNNYTKDKIQHFMFIISFSIAAAALRSNNFIRANIHIRIRNKIRKKNIYNAIHTGFLWLYQNNERLLLLQ